LLMLWYIDLLISLSDTLVTSPILVSCTLDKQAHFLWFLNIRD
jgi:hypothetical protein